MRHQRYSKTKFNFFIPCASPPLVKTAIHWPAPSTFSKVGNRVRAKASLLAAGSSVSKSNETSSAFRLRGCFPVPEGNMSCFSLLVSSMSKYKITWDIIVGNVYRLYPNSPKHRPQYMQHCTDRCSALMFSSRSKGPRFVGLRKFYCGDFCRRLADSQRSLTEVGQVCNQILNSQEEFSSK